MNNQALNLYARTQIQTASPGELTLMLYNGCIKFLKQAIEDLQSKNYQGKNNNIQRSIDILDELLITLDMQYDISKNLSALYTYMKEQLFEANVKLKKENLEHVVHLMTELRDAWAEALKSLKTNTKVGV